MQFHAGNRSRVSTDASADDISSDDMLNSPLNTIKKLGIGWNSASLWGATLLVAAVRVVGPVLRESPHGRYRWAEVLNTAYSVYRFGDWRDPFGAFPTGPSAHVAPLFPLFIAGIYHLFGDGAAGSRALALAEAAAIFLQIALLPMVTRALWVNSGVAVVAALFAIVGAREMPETEGNYTAVLLMLATSLACRYARLPGSPGHERSPLGGAVIGGSPMAVASLAGLLWGVILLITPSAATVWLAWLALAAWQSRKAGWHQTWLPAFLVPLLVVLPWTLGNYHVLGGFVPLRSNFGLELKLSNNPCAAVSLNAPTTATGCFQHPSVDATEAQKLARAGEIAYNRTRKEEALAWIRQNPRLAAALWVQRAEIFWFPSQAPTSVRFSRQNWVWRWTAGLATALSIPGLWFLYRKNQAGAVLCALILLAFPFTYYLVRTDDRYRFPIMWVSFVLAAIGIRSIVAAAKRQFGFAQPAHKGAV
jgi:hypothetical protein